MISDGELEALLGEAAAAIVVRQHGADAIIEALGASDAPQPVADTPRPRAAFAGRRPVFTGIALAAVAALAVSVVLVSTGGTPVVQGSGKIASSTLHSTVEAAPAVVAPSVKSGPAHVTSPAVAAGRDIAITGTLVLVVSGHALAVRVERLDALVANLGGYVASSDVKEAGRELGGTVVVEVPASRFAELSSRASVLGSVQSLSSNATDVTDQVVDLSAQLGALQGELSRLETLALRTASVSSLLSVEDEITNVESQINEIESQQRSVATQVSDASLSVALEVRTAPHRTASERGFARSWHDAVNGFLAALHGLVASLGVLFFVVLALLALGLIARFPGRSIWRAARRRLL